LSKLHFSSVLLLYYVRLSHILLNTVLLCYKETDMAWDGLWHNTE